MQHNEITVSVDVKMDLKERRSEFAVYRVANSIVFYLDQ